MPWAEGLSSPDAVLICTVTSQIKSRIQMTNLLALVSLFSEYLYPFTFHILDWVGISGAGIALILAGLIYCIRGSSHLGLAPQYLPMEARAQPHIQMSGRLLQTARVKNSLKMVSQLSITRSEAFHFLHRIALSSE